jgi:hypothetical protein
MMMIFIVCFVVNEWGVFALWSRNSDVSCAREEWVQGLGVFILGHRKEISA